MLRPEMVNGTGTGMLGRIAVAATTMVVALPAVAGELNFDAAKRLVAGKLFAYSCFDGTTGAGRINPDGAVAGTIQIQGSGPLRFVTLPAGTVHNRNGSICATVKGLPISPCFNVVQTSPNHFRGSIWGLGFAYCDFTRRGGRIEMARANSRRAAMRAANVTSASE
jgi:hypothetical protein